MCVHPAASRILSRFYLIEYREFVRFQVGYHPHDLLGRRAGHLRELTQHHGQVRTGALLGDLIATSEEENRTPIKSARVVH